MLISVGSLFHMQTCESKFLKDRPHSKGLINRIMFTPWDDPCFITGGCDHAVVLWREQCESNAWKSRLLHKDLHTSAVMGVAGMRHNNLVLSCGDDRRFIGFDAREEKVTFKHRLDNKCTNLLPNPRDVNLVMLQTRYKKDSYYLPRNFFLIVLYIQAARQATSVVRCKIASDRTIFFRVEAREQRVAVCFNQPVLVSGWFAHLIWLFGPCDPHL